MREMREIKFRAWDGSEMWYEYFSITNKGFTFWTDDGVGCSLTLMQYTGLLDKNGKEIYEGDIIKTILCKGDSPKLSVVNYGEWTLDEWSQLYFGYQIDNHSCKIIGNIYENKELINKNDQM